MIIETDRLRLRRWKNTDLETMSRINADPRVMEFFPSTMSLEQTESMIARIETEITEKGFGSWAVERKSDRSLIGFIGLHAPHYTTPFTPCIEIGWRLASTCWGHGYATEGATQVLRYAANVLHLPEVVSFATVANVRSRRVMEKIGMIRDLDGDFDHPLVDENHPLKRHVLYRSKLSSV